MVLMVQLAAFSSLILMAIGAVAFGAAGMACIFASRRAPTNQQGEARLWLLFAIVLVTMAIEAPMNGRTHVRKWTVEQVKETDQYEARRPKQTVAMVVLAAMAAGFFAIAWRVTSRRHPSLRITALCVISGIALYVTEAISLHAVDHVIWHPIGPLLVNVWGWCLVSVMIVVAAKRYPQRRESTRGKQYNHNHFDRQS